MEPIFFSTASEFHQWLMEHHTHAREVVVGIYRKGSGERGPSLNELATEAMCFGWVEVIRKRIDETRYMVRLVPRKPNGQWSARHVKLTQELIDMGLMQPEAQARFEARFDGKPVEGQHENRPEKLSEELEALFRAQKSAWVFFCEQPRGYQRVACFWVMKAKREETRLKRLAELMEDSAAGRRLARIGSG